MKHMYYIAWVRLENSLVFASDLEKSLEHRVTVFFLWKVLQSILSTVFKIFHTNQGRERALKHFRGYLRNGFN